MIPALTVSGYFKQTLDGIPVAINIQRELVKQLIVERFKENPINSTRYLECLSEALTGFGSVEDSTDQQMEYKYCKALEEYYTPFMGKHEYVIENYLVNYAFKNLFPIGGGRSVFDNYVMMIVHYALIKIHLIGMAGYHKEGFGTNHIVKLIQSLGKAMEHNVAYLNRAFDFLKQNNFANMAGMAILIKN